MRLMRFRINEIYSKMVEIGTISGFLGGLLFFTANGGHVFQKEDV